jgi:hypothetical protein
MNPRSMDPLSMDALRARLSRLDPAGPAVPVDPATSPRAAGLMERAMQQLSDLPAPVDLSARRRRRPVRWAAAAAAAAAGVGVVVGTGGGGGVAGPPTTLALSLPATGAASGACLAFDEATLRGMPVAFSGTVTATGGDRVALDVDHWYRGGDADRVTLEVPAGQSSAALDGVDFRSGERYLVSATDRTVSTCGYSGPATPQLEDAYRRAFGG